MQLITDELRAKLPPLYSHEDKEPEEVPVVAKFFTPWAGWTWYATEYSEVAPDGTPRLAYGYVVGLEAELGYFSIDELESLRGPVGLTIERDLYVDLTDVTLADLLNGRRP